MSGYTLNGIVGRIRDLEAKTNGAYYVALCWLAMTRNSGKGSRKLLETKVFGTGKPTSTFRNAWRIADKAFAEGFHAGNRQSVAKLALDEAVEFAVDALQAHRLALGVSSMKEYEEVCRYADESSIPSASPDEPLLDNSEEAAKPDAAPTPMDTAITAMMALDAAELVAFAAKVQQRIASFEGASFKQAA